MTDKLLLTIKNCGIYLEVNFEEIYLGCSKLNDIDNFLFKFGFKRVGLRKADKRWCYSIYSKNNILIAKLYYLFLPLTRVKNFLLLSLDFYEKIYQR